jgi:hypothetical protein
MLKTFWLEHQKFLLATGGVLVVFLLANRMLSGFAEEAARDYRHCRELQKQIDGLHKQLKRTYWAEAVRVERLGEQETTLAAQVAMPADPDVSGGASLLIGLNKKIDDVWTEAQAIARPKGLALPEKLSGSDFDIDPSYGPREYGIFHSYLEIVRRGLVALANCGVTRIGRPEPLGELESPVAADGQIVGYCLYRAVSVSVDGPYDAFVRLGQLLEEPGSFLQLRIAGELRSVRGAPGTLRAELEFHSFRVREIQPAAAALPGLTGDGARTR